MSGTLSLTFGNTPGSVTIPIDVSGVAVSVDWGDGSPVNTSLSHTYSGAGPYTAVMTITSGTFTHFGYVGWLGVDRLISVSTSNTATWGLGGAVTSFANLFDGAFGLISVPTDIPPSVTNLAGLFLNASTFNQDISGWNVSNVTFMNEMFAGATSFNQDISSWDVSSVQNTSNMFASATAFNNGSLTDDEAHPLTAWDIGSVIIMSGMFASASSFNQDIGSWDTTSATLMEGMFYGATIFNQDIGGWDVSHVVNTKLMFHSATNFNGDISGWNVSNVVNMNSMFMIADNFSQNIGIWNVGNVTDMGFMFYGLASFNLDISGWDVSSVTDMQRMFYNTPSFNRDISGWDVSSVTNMTQMFVSSIIFNQNIRIWSVGAGTDLTDMFDSATAFQARFYPTTPGYNTDPNEPLYTFFNYSPTPPPPTPSAPVLRLPVGGGGGSFWFGREGFLFKGKGGGGARRSTKMAPGGNTTCNGPTYIYNKYKPGGGGVGASSIANRRAKNRLATICGRSQNKCFPCFPTLGQYSNYTHNPNGYVPCLSSTINVTPSPTPPSTPTLVSLTPINGGLIINFTLGLTGVSPITDIEYSTDNGVTWTSSGQTSSPIVVTGLTNGVSYLVAIRAINIVGPSPSSNVISGTPVTTPSAPTLDSLTRGNGQLTLNFTLGSDGGSAITDIEYSTNNGVTWTSSGATSSPIVVTGLTNGVTYPVAVRAINIVGTSTSSNVISGTPATAPSAPTLNSLTSGNGQLTLNFTLGSNGGSAITNIEYSTNNGVTWTSSGATSSPIVVTGLTNGVTYQVAVRAINIVGTSPSSNVISGTPSAPGPSPPTALSGVGGNQAAYILFTQIGTITNYEYSTDDGATFLPFAPAQTFSPVEINTLSSDGATRLTNGTTYNVKLKAVSSGGSSVESVSVSVTPTITSLLPTGRLIYLDANNSSSYPGSGTAWTNLDSGGAYSATLQNSPTFDNINKWFTFNGTNQIAQIAAAAAINPTTPFGSFTIQIWARVNTASPNFANGDGLISKQFGPGSYDGYSLSLSTSGAVVLNMNGGSVNGNYGSSAGVYSNGWALYTIVVRFGGGSGNPSYTYVSTRRVVTANNGETSMPSSTAPLQFPRGIQDTTFNFCPADVGAFYLYNTALSQANIIQNYDATKPTYI